MSKYYLIGRFAVNGLENSPYRNAAGIEKAMESELVRAYNLYCDKANKLIPEMNDAYESIRNPYESNHVDQERYNKFVADYFTDRILAKYRFDKISELLDFYIDADNDDVFTGYLKADPSITIYFYVEPPKES